MLLPVATIFYPDIYIKSGISWGAQNLIFIPLRDPLLPIVLSQGILTILQFTVLVQNFVEGIVFIKKPLKPKFTATGHE